MRQGYDRVVLGVVQVWVGDIDVLFSQTKVNILISV